MPSDRDYIPALHFDWLTPWYDRFMAALYPEARIKGCLIAQASLRPGDKALDLGCGTATLALMMKRAQPSAEVHGLDVDPKTLAIARNKARQSAAAIALVRGSAVRLPYADHTFDHVFASLMLHHLARQEKRLALAEVWRVLAPGGALHVVDFGAPHDRTALLLSLVTRWFEEIHDHVRGMLPAYMREAGFQGVEETAHYGTVSGTFRSYRGKKPEQSLAVQDALPSGS